MKWNIFVGSMVLGLSLCTQSFGFDLLDRMLGVNGCGADTAKSCCVAGPKCGADPSGCTSKGDSCGRQRLCTKKIDLSSLKGHCNRGCGDKGCAKGGNGGCANKGCAAPAAAGPTCAAAAAPSCAAKAAAAPTCAAAAAPTCAAAAAPSCGADHGACKSACRQICRPGLLDRLMSIDLNCKKKSCSNGCTNGGCANKGCAAPAAAPACGCDGHAAPAAKAGVEAPAPQPPAPVVDPSAFHQNTQRRVVQASTSLVR